MDLLAQEVTNFARLSRLLINIGTHALRQVFDSLHPPSQLHSTLNSAGNFTILRGLKRKRVLQTQQWNILYPSVKGTVTSTAFDITLLFLLLRNMCGLTPPATGWGEMPSITDLSLEADLVRLKIYRNELFAHMPRMSLTDSEFTTYWDAIADVLKRLGGPQYEADIQSLLNEAMDPDDEAYYNDILRSWEERDDRLMSEIWEIKRMLLNAANPTNPPANNGAQPQQVAQTQHITYHGPVYQIRQVEHLYSDPTRNVQINTNVAAMASSSATPENLTQPEVPSLPPS